MPLFVIIAVAVAVAVDDDGRRVASVVGFVVGIEDVAALGIFDARDAPIGRGRA